MFKRKRNRKQQLGQGLAEFALVLPVLIIMLSGLFEIGRALLILISIENAAAEGAIYGATHPACLTNDHAATICQGTESVAGRTREEGRPVFALTDENSTVTIVIEGDGLVKADNVLRIEVEASFSPITPIGNLLWGEMATVSAVARQKILSPPPPGYTY